MLDFVKDVLNLDIFDWEPKYACGFLACVSQFPYFLESFSTHLTKQCFKCLLHMNKHINEVTDVTFVEESSG